MQIVYKVKEGRIKDAKKVVTDSVASVLAERAPEASVEQVFPGLTTGRRARLFTIDLPDSVPEPKLRELIEALRGEDAVEEAHLPAEKKPQ
jgi:hypothetical protein